MVPPLEPSEYIPELRNVADIIVRDRLEHNEVHEVRHDAHDVEVEEPVDHADVQESFPEGSGNLGTPVGPAFHIPMTQEKSLEDLPSQIDFEWQDSVSLNLTPAQATNVEVPEIVEATEHRIEQDANPPIVSN